MRPGDHLRRAGCSRRRRPTVRRLRARLSLHLGAALLTLLAACGAETGGHGGSDATLTAFPAPADLAAVAPGPSGAAFAGAAACAECHAEEHSAWRASTHGRAGGLPGPEVVRAPFDGTAIRFADAVVVPRVRGGRWEFIVRQTGHPEVAFGVDGVIGGGHMIGGGTQGFVSRSGDGTVRFLPWDWSVTDGRWFCNTGSRTDQGWRPIEPSMRLADCGDWFPTRPLGTVERFANCQQCHGSGIRTLQVEGEGFETTWASLAVDCESCHGPAADHVVAAREGAEDPAIASLRWQEKEASLAVCLQCHALKDVVGEGLPHAGRDGVEYATRFPALGDRPYLPDGRVRTFAYQATHLASACYLEGPMDCVSCHAPHDGGYWTIDREPLPDPFADGQCTGCHASKGTDPQAHTAHPAEVEVRCVDCHMPYLQHPEVGEGTTFARSDHTISIPRPALDAQFGIEGACRSCHADLASAVLQAEVEARWGPVRPLRPLAAALAADRGGWTPAEAGRALLHPEAFDPLLQFQALAVLAEEFLRPGVSPDPSTRDRLERLARGEDLELRALALALLHWTEGDRPGTRAVLVEALRSTSTDPGADASLRGRWRIALGYFADRALDRGDATGALHALAAALEIAPGHPDLLHALGRAHLAAGRPDAARTALEAAIRADPTDALPRVELGHALTALGDSAAAETAWRDAVRVNPHEALAHYALGNLHQRRGDHSAAAESYAAATTADPSLGLAWFELARSRIRLERFEGALTAARRAVEFMPDHGLSRQMLADLERAFAGSSGTPPG